MADLAPRRKWRPDGFPHGGAGGFHYPQRADRTSYLGTSAGPRRTRKRRAPAPLAQVVLNETIQRRRLRDLLRAPFRRAA